MTLSNFTLQAMASGGMGQYHADEVRDVIDNDGIGGAVGALSTAAKTRLRYACANNVASSLATKINADTALTALERRVLALALGSQGAANEIGTEQGS